MYLDEQFIIEFKHMSQFSTLSDRYHQLDEIVKDYLSRQRSDNWTPLHGWWVYESLARVVPENTALRCNGVLLFSKDNIVHTRSHYFVQQVSPRRDTGGVIWSPQPQ